MVSGSLAKRIFRRLTHCSTAYMVAEDDNTATLEVSQNVLGEGMASSPNNGSPS